MSRLNRTFVRAMTASRPVDVEEDRAEWQQSFSIIPDFDLVNFEAEAKEADQANNLILDDENE